MNKIVAFSLLLILISINLCKAQVTPSNNKARAMLINANPTHPTRFVVMGDPDNKDANANPQYIHQKFIDALSEVEIENGTNPIDFIVIVGDLTPRGRNMDYIVYNSFINEQMDTMGIPIFSVPGNHDLAEWNSFAKYKEYIDSGSDQDFFFDYNGSRFIIYNNVQKDQIGGTPFLYTITDDQINKIDNWLKNAPSNRFTFAHVPFSVPSYNSGGLEFRCHFSSTLNPTYPQIGYYGFHQLHQKHKVRASFTGHKHDSEGSYFYDQIDGVDYFITSGVGGGAESAIASNNGSFYTIHPDRILDFNWMTVTVDANNNVSTEIKILGKTRTASLNTNGLKSSDFNENLGTISAPNSAYDNKWEKAWSNDGNGTIDIWKVRDYDEFYPGDFDGDGDEELLCIQKVNGNMNLANIMEFQTADWTEEWTNSSSDMIGLWSLHSKDIIYIGNFDDNNNNDEVLFVNDPADGNDMHMYRYNNGSWQLIWDNGGLAIGGIYDCRLNLTIGDFNGDNKDELIGPNTANGETEMYNFTVAPWGNSFSKIWDDSPSHSIRTYQAQLIAGDFDGDNKDELLGMKSWVTMFNFNNNNFNWGWSSYGANNIGGWPYPLDPSHRFIIGDIDDTDDADEITFFRTGPNAAWATSMDFNNGWNWNWSANDSYATPFLNDWAIADQGGSDTRYYTVLLDASLPEFVLCMRKHECVDPQNGDGYNYIASLYKSKQGSDKRLKRPDSIEDVYEDVLNDEVTIYPNPTNSIITIETKMIYNQLRFYNILGKEVKLVNGLIPRIDVSDLEPGMYFINILDQNTKVLNTIKFIKN